MRPTLLLAWRYLTFHRLVSSALAVGVALTVFLPLAVQLLVHRYSASLVARAQATPLVLGAPGSRYDLVLDSLYFRGRTPSALSMAEVEELAADERATPIPLYTPVSAADGDVPVVGTTHEYYGFRGLVPASGDLPGFLGECVVGARVARDLDLSPGDHLLTDRESLYDLARAYPLRLRVVGVLAPTAGPDDGAVFCDIKTAWIAQGIGHGHADSREQDERAVLSRDGQGGVVLDASVLEYNEITPENVDRFHFHGEPADLPVTGVLVVPADPMARTILKGRYRVRDGVQLLEPPVVMGELLGFVLDLKVFFDANAALVGGATALFLGVIVTLSLALRRRERLTLFKIGCARRTVARLMATEQALVVGSGVLIAAVLAGLFVQLVSHAVPI